MILGLTGGIGCGKSTAARAFVSRGSRLVDSDALIREQVLTSPVIIAAVSARYGSDVLSAQGGIDRGQLAAKVFADDEERGWLEGLTHPALFAIWRSTLATAPRARWVFEVPLLFEQALENWFDFTVCVACSPQQQLVRLEQRGLSRELAGQRISKQLPLARKIELADMVLWNDGSAAFLQAQVDTLVASLPGRC
ncbi:MAG: dephospho-CoA kinase [Undibacterium sp.]|nr:dephospho-CoA kinase [Opitutaceae bacterium]